MTMNINGITSTQSFVFSLSNMVVRLGYDLFMIYFLHFLIVICAAKNLSSRRNTYF